jgi:hypothetical protein
VDFIGLDTKFDLPDSHSRDQFRLIDHIAYWKSEGADLAVPHAHETGNTAPLYSALQDLIVVIQENAERR